MSSGVYGNVTPASFTPSDDAEIWLSYRTDRSVEGDGFTQVDVGKFLSQETGNTGNITGLYRLKLPMDTFNKVGIYNVYIRPKQIPATIQDVGVLYSYPDIRGIILNSSLLSGSTIDNDGLVGYKIEYLDSNGNKKPNFYRIITSNNKCEPTNQNSNGSTSYRLNDNSNLIFCTVSPSSASSAKPLSPPYIGAIQDNIILSNTYFNPEFIEIELTENDLETLYTSINGDQIRTLDTGLVTTYDNNQNIFAQSEHYIIKETETGTPVYEVKVNKTDIDFSQNYTDIVGNV